MVAIPDGLKAGEHVVTEGGDRLKDGARGGRWQARQAGDGAAAGRAPRRAARAAPSAVAAPGAGARRRSRAGAVSRRRA